MHLHASQEATSSFVILESLISKTCGERETRQPGSGANQEAQLMSGKSSLGSVGSLGTREAGWRCPGDLDLWTLFQRKGVKTT